MQLGGEEPNQLLLLLSMHSQAQTQGEIGIPSVDPLLVFINIACSYKTVWALHLGKEILLFFLYKAMSKPNVARSEIIGRIPSKWDIRTLPGHNTKYEAQTISTALHSNNLT